MASSLLSNGFYPAVRATVLVAGLQIGSPIQMGVVESTCSFEGNEMIEFKIVRHEIKDIISFCPINLL
jgi:hypothetical protein